MQTIIDKMLPARHHTVLANEVVRNIVSQQPSIDTQGRHTLKVEAHKAQPGDIELVSRRHPDQNLVIDYVEEYSDVAVLVFYVGHPSPREVMKDRLLTVAR